MSPRLRTRERTSSSSSLPFGWDAARPVSALRRSLWTLDIHPTRQRRQHRHRALAVLLEALVAVGKLALRGLGPGPVGIRRAGGSGEHLAGVVEVGGSNKVATHSSIRA